MSDRDEETRAAEIIPNTTRGPRAPGDPEYTGIHPPGEDDPGRPEEFEEGKVEVEPLGGPGGTITYPEPANDIEPHPVEESPDADLPRPI
jgi:hypothetical protein